MKGRLLSPDVIPPRRKCFAAAAESFAEKIEEMLLRCEEAAVTGELKEAPEKLLSPLLLWQVWEAKWRKLVNTEKVEEMLLGDRSSWKKELKEATEKLLSPLCCSGKSGRQIREN